MLHLPPSTSAIWPFLRSKPFILACCFVLSITILWNSESLRPAWPNQLTIVNNAQPLDRPDAYSANSTLGAIFAVSGENQSDPHSWRQTGMLAAAQRTGLQIQIRQQPDFTVQEFLDFRGQGSGAHPGEGSALAWMNHIDTMKHIVANSISSALILEDDADWDVHIRSSLAPAAALAGAIRNLTGVPDDSLFLSAPFGTSFDVIWLGHCGATSFPTSKTIRIHDDNMLPPHMLRALWGPAYAHLTEGQRDVFTGVHATCTYAYAITLEGARKGIELLQKGGSAFDNELGSKCKEGQLNCLGVAPELFHQMNKVGEAGLIHAVDDSLKGTEQEHQKNDQTRFWTMNIKNSARCNANHREDDLVQCLPTDDEFNSYPSR